RTQLHQVLMNLATNAEYAMRQTGGLLEIGVETVHAPHDGTAHPRTLAPGAYVCLRIRDTGQGMPPAVVEHIFESLSTTGALREGTGLGLAIVPRMVPSHGGAFTMASASGQGPTLRLNLLSLVSTAPAAPRPPAEGLPQGKGRLLLVVDEALLTCVGQ